MAETTQWRPAAGQIALIEPVDASPGRDCLTGVVVPGERILIDLGASPRPESDAAEVVASFFAPDALYRLFAKAHEEADGLVSLDVSAIERVQRRANPRVQVVLPPSSVMTRFRWSCPSASGWATPPKPPCCRARRSTCRSAAAGS